MRADFIPHDRKAKPIHFECLFEREQYPKTSQRRHRAERRARHRRHMLDFLAAIETRGRPVADVEDGHISTASCILANIAMDLGRPLVYDPVRRVVVGDREATQQLGAPTGRPGIIRAVRDRFPGPSVCRLRGRAAPSRTVVPRSSAPVQDPCVGPFSRIDSARLVV
jgi:hypothetical protein